MIAQHLHREDARVDRWIEEDHAQERDREVVQLSRFKMIVAPHSRCDS